GTSLGHPLPERPHPRKDGSASGVWPSAEPWTWTHPDHTASSCALPQTFRQPFYCAAWRQARAKSARPFVCCVSSSDPHLLGLQSCLPLFSTIKPAPSHFCRGQQITLNCDRWRTGKQKDHNGNGATQGLDEVCGRKVHPIKG